MEGFCLNFGIDMLNQHNLFSLIAVLAVVSLFLSHITAHAQRNLDNQLFTASESLQENVKKDTLMKVNFNWKF